LNAAPGDPAAAAPAASRPLGVISNPGSGRNRRLIGRLRGALACRRDVLHAETASAADIPAVLRRFAAAGVEAVGINGGDGSVALVLTALHAEPAMFARPPLLCALPGGTTNVTVGDVGIRGALEPALLRLLAWSQGRAAGARVLERPVIGVRGADGRLLGCGLVFGAGAVVDGIEYWHEAVRARGMRSELSSGVAMVRTVWGMVSGHERFGAAHPMRIAPQAASPVAGEFMLLVVSALERLFLGIHPFWNEAQPGALRLTAIERGARGFALALPTILRGRPGAVVRPENGYHSLRCGRLELGFEGGFTLDGELHHMAPGESPLTVFDAGRARFLRI
jgi:hypothetical protein